MDIEFAGSLLFGRSINRIVLDVGLGLVLEAGRVAASAMFCCFGRKVEGKSGSGCQGLEVDSKCDK